MNMYKYIILCTPCENLTTTCDCVLIVSQDIYALTTHLRSPHCFPFGIFVQIKCPKSLQAKCRFFKIINETN